jgi:hypothetical protein
LMSSSSDWIGVVAPRENSFTRIAKLRQDPGFLFAAERAASKAVFIHLGLEFLGNDLAPHTFRALHAGEDCFP